MRQGFELSSGAQFSLGTPKSSDVHFELLRFERKNHRFSNCVTSIIHDRLHLKKSLINICFLWRTVLLEHEAQFWSKPNRIRTENKSKISDINYWAYLLYIGDTGFSFWLLNYGYVKVRGNQSQKIPNRTYCGQKELNPQNEINFQNETKGRVIAQAYITPF